MFRKIILLSVFLLGIQMVEGKRLSWVEGSAVDMSSGSQPGVTDVQQDPSVASQPGLAQEIVPAAL